MPSARRPRPAGPPSFARRTAALVACAGALVGAADGCGSRGPLDDTPLVDAALVDPDAGTADDAEADSPAPGPDAATPADAGPFVACGACLFGTCGQAIGGCVGSDACRAVFQCVLGQCLAGGDAGGGGFDPACLLSCAGADPEGALQAFAVVQCVTNDCGTICADVLGALGGLGGPGGGADGG